MEGGSSPGVRGTVRDSHLGFLRQRIIPGRAGNRAPSASFPPASSDHPRACGEQVAGQNTRKVSTGSSPGVRGTGLQEAPRGSMGWIIPGRAGNRKAAGRDFDSRPDHPRACGEQCAGYAVVEGVGGSSPGVRGTVFWGGKPEKVRRIIPGRAGNRNLRHFLACSKSDHPRACGEQTVMEHRGLVFRGSSPGVRGTVICSLRST